MGKIGKALGWLFVLALIGYVAFSIITGQSASSGEAIRVPATGQPAKVLTFPDCVDTDHGKTYGIQGNTYNTDDEIVREDYCDDNETLVEFFCSNKYPDRITVPCACNGGACR